MGSTSADRHDVWRALVAAHGAVTEQLASELSRAQDLPLSWYDVLAHLAACEHGRARMQELATAVARSKSGLTRLVQRLEVAGLVRREACDEDGRGTFAVLTPAGTARWLAARPIHAEVVARHVTDLLDPGQSRLLVTVLGTIADGSVGS